jgi:hypothetical protein
VTIEDQVAAIFARANPVPSLAQFDPIELVDIGRLTDQSERSSEMSELQAIEPELDRQPKQRHIIGLVAAGVIVVATAVAVIVFANRGQEVAASPVEIAESFLEARNAHDAEAMSALLADDAVFVPGEELVMNEGNLPEAAEFERITGWSHGVQSCVEDPPSRVRCSYTLENDLGRAIGLQPSEHNFVVFDIEEGKIATVQNSGDSSYIGSGMSAFGNWLEENHPEELGTMTSTEFEGNKFSPEFFAIWERRVPEFVAEESGG